MKRLAVIIPTHNRCKELKQLLISLDGQKLEDSIQVIPIIVVDGSEDSTLEMLDSYYPNAIVVKGNGQWWYTKSINEGFKKAIKNDFDLVLTMNDDCLLSDDYLNNLLKDYQGLSNPSNRILGSISFSIEKPHRVVFSGIKKIIWWRYKVKYYHEINSRISPGKVKGVHKSCSLPGRGILISVELLGELGLFDEKFKQYGSDSEFIFRARKNDYEVFISWNAILYTYISKTGEGSIHTKEDFLKFLKNFFNPHARNNLMVICRLVWRYGYKLLSPITIMIKIAGHFKNHFKSNYINE